MLKVFQVGYHDNLLCNINFQIQSKFSVEYTKQIHVESKHFLKNQIVIVF